MIANPINACLGYFHPSRRFRSLTSCMWIALAPLVECASSPTRTFLDGIFTVCCHEIKHIILDSDIIPLAMSSLFFDHSTQTKTPCDRCV